MLFSLKNSFSIYLFIGIINTIIGYFIIFTLMWFKFSPELSNFIGYFVSIFLSFYLNERYNFKSGVKYSKGLIKFFISMGIAYLLNLGCVVVSIEIFKINSYFAQILGGVVYTLTGYLLSKFFVFRI